MAAYAAIVEGRSAGQQRVIIQRIRACHHISLAGEFPNPSAARGKSERRWEKKGEDGRRRETTGEDGRRREKKGEDGRRREKKENVRSEAVQDCKPMTCSPTGAAAENRGKLQKLFALLWKLIGQTVRGAEVSHCLSLACSTALVAKTVSFLAGSQDRSNALQIVDVFSEHIVEMAASMPEFAGALAMKYLQVKMIQSPTAHCALSLDSRAYSCSLHVVHPDLSRCCCRGVVVVGVGVSRQTVTVSCVQAIAGGHKQARDDRTHGWPPIESLFYLQLCAVVFPPSDFVHPVLTPAVSVPPLLAPPTPTNANQRSLLI